jgi:hypothetical protein
MTKAKLLNRALLVRSGLELAVIITGVLIALWADQWWADRQDAQVQRTYLAALSEDISATVQRLGETTAKVVEWREAAATLSRSPLAGPFPSSQELVPLIGTALFNLSSFQDRLATLRELKSTGELGLIRNADIRRSLADLDQALEDMRSTESDLIQTHHAIIDPYMVQHTDLVPMILASSTRSSMDRFLGAGVGTDHTSLMQDREFRNILAFRILLLNNCAERYGQLASLLLTLQQQIDTELAR